MFFVKEIISSRNNPTVKWAANLANKKGRDESQTFIAEGEKLCLEILNEGLCVTHIFITESRSKYYLDRIEKFGSQTNYSDTIVIILKDDVFSKISTEKAPQGIIIAVKYLDFFNNADIIYKEDFFLSNDEKAIILNSIRDPGNLGAVIRSSVAFGVNHIILTSDCTDIYNPKTIRSAMGSLLRVKVTTVDNLCDFITYAKLSGRRVLAAELTENAKSIKDIELNEKDIVIIGNEGHGISREISNVCSASVYIPISNKTESLNAAVAAAIFMWEQIKNL